MRTTVATLGLSLMIPAAIAAQASSPQAVTPAPERLTVTPVPPARPRLDFGLEQAKERLPGPWRIVTMNKHQLPMGPSLSPELLASTQGDGANPIDCAMVKKHNHEPMAMRVIPPPTAGKHHLKTVTVPPCPVR